MLGARGGIELTLYLLAITLLKNYLLLKGQQKGQQFLAVPFWYGWLALTPRHLKNLLRKPAQAVPGPNRLPVVACVTISPEKVACVT